MEDTAIDTNSPRLPVRGNREPGRTADRADYCPIAAST